MQKKQKPNIVQPLTNLKQNPDGEKKQKEKIKMLTVTQFERAANQFVLLFLELFHLSTRVLCSTLNTTVLQYYVL